jgi:hypothetical protein
MGAPCPQGPRDTPAILKANHPHFIVWGLISIVTSSFVNWFFVEAPEEPEEDRAERRRQFKLALKRGGRPN